MVEIKNVTKSFGTLQVLKGIDLNVKKAEIVAIVGSSGAGKTTLLQILGTLSRPDSGEITINGIEVGKLKEKRLAQFRNKQIGFVFQFHHLLPEFNALENVCIPAFIGKMQRKEATSRAKEIMRFLNIDHRFTHKPRELSGGEQQRVAVARALINNPSIILADEPSGNLDTKNKQELHELFFKLRDKYQQTFVIVTHDTSLADMSDRVITIKDGLIL